MITYSRHLLYQILHQDAIRWMACHNYQPVLPAFSCQFVEFCPSWRRSRGHLPDERSPEGIFSSALCIDTRLSRVESLAALLSFETYYLPLQKLWKSCDITHIQEKSYSLGLTNDINIWKRSSIKPRYSENIYQPLAIRYIKVLL